MSLTIEQLQEDVTFLLSRTMEAGRCDFTQARWTGTSSNALVAYAYGGKQDAMPHDRGDYAACVRTYHRLPSHRKTAEVRAALITAREHYLSRYPEDRFPGPRNEAGDRQKAEWEASQKKRRRRAA